MMQAGQIAAEHKYLIRLQVGDKLRGMHIALVE